ncbi:MAG: NAD(P)/FAD-dependent oxidoreductase [Chloroflexota bacterium]
MSDYDVIMVGGGHNGLLVSAYLAKAGLNVCILEARAFPGGGVVTEEVTAPGFKHDLASTAAGSIEFNALIKNDELGLVKRSGIKFAEAPEVQETQLFPDGRSIILYRSLDKTCASIAKVSQKDADAFRRLYDIGFPILKYILAGSTSPPAPFSTSLQGMLSRPGGLEDLRMTFLNAVDFVEEWFENDLVKIAMTRLAAIARFSPWEATTAGIITATIPFTMNYGTKPVIGGVGKFTEALTEAIKAFGGTIRLNAPVKEIIVENNQAKGVVLADGEKLGANKCVVAAINVKTLFPDMVPGAQLPGGFEDWIKRLKPQRVQYFTTHYALHQTPQYKADPDVSRSYQVHLTGTTSYDEYLNGLQAMYRGIPRTTSPGILCPSMFDSSRVPPGKHTLWVNSQEPFYLKGGPRRWDEIKEQVVSDILKAIRSHTTNMGPDNIIAEKTFSPLDFSRWNPAWIEGDPSHLGGYIQQYSSFRPVPGWSGYKMPIDRLYMCGPSAHGGTGLAAGGRAPASVIMTDLGIEFEKVAAAQQ